MSPEILKPKKERVYTPPSFIDEAFIKKLPRDKQVYWANRIQGIPGQGAKPAKSEIKPTGEARTFFDNEGNMVVKNRLARRTRPITPPYFTKSTHSLKKLRGQIK